MNMAMKQNGPTIMLRFSVSRPVFVDVLDEGPDHQKQCGLSVVQYANWSEKLGVSETSISECWKPLAPNIFLAMSQKK